MIPCHNFRKAKAIKSKKSLKKNNTYQSKVSKREVLNCHKILFVRELKYEVHCSHKRTLWDRGFGIKFSKKGIQEDSYQKN